MLKATRRMLDYFDQKGMRYHAEIDRTKSGKDIVTVTYTAHNLPQIRFRYYFDEHTKKLYDRGEEIPATPMMLSYVNDFSRNIRRTIDGSIGDLRLVSNYLAARSGKE